MKFVNKLQKELGPRLHANMHLLDYKYPPWFTAHSVFPASRLGYCHKHRTKKSNKSELQEDVGNRYDEKAVSAVHARAGCEGRKAP